MKTEGLSTAKGVWRPDSRHYTPLATIVLFIGNIFGVSRAGAGSDWQDRERQGSRARADMDVLVASPGNHYPPRLPARKHSETAVVHTLLAH